MNEHKDLWYRETEKKESKRGKMLTIVNLVNGYTSPITFL